MSLIDMKMNLYAEHIFIWMVSHKDLIWHRGKRQLGNGLLFVNCNPYLLSGGSRHCKWKFLGQLSHLAILPVAPPHIQQLSPPAAWNDTRQTQCDHRDKIQHQKLRWRNKWRWKLFTHLPTNDENLISSYFIIVLQSSQVRRIQEIINKRMITSLM